MCRKVLNVVLGLEEWCGVYGGWEGGVLWYTWRVGCAVGERVGVTVQRVREERKGKTKNNVWTHTHTHIHTHMHTCTHAHMHTCKHAHTHACAHTPRRRGKRLQVLLSLSLYTHTHNMIYTHIRVQRCVCVRVCVRVVPP